MDPACPTEDWRPGPLTKCQPTRCVSLQRESCAEEADAWLQITQLLVRLLRGVVALTSLCLRLRLLLHYRRIVEEKPSANRHRGWVFAVGSLIARAGPALPMQQCNVEGASQRPWTKQAAHPCWWGKRNRKHSGDAAQPPAAETNPRCHKYSHLQMHLLLRRKKARLLLPVV